MKEIAERTTPKTKAAPKKIWADKEVKEVPRETKEDAKTFTVSINNGQETVVGKGKTILEALASAVKPVKLVGKTFLEVTDGTKSAKQMYLPVRAKRLFYPNAQVFIAKQLQTLMK